MRRLSAILGLCILCLPSPGQAASIFDLFYEETKQADTALTPSKRIMDFIIREMETWGEDGIILTKPDIDAAITGDLSTLCRKKQNAAHKDIELPLGNSTDPYGCVGLQQNILSVIRNEREAEELGTDLLTLSNGSELAIADEPGRPVSMSQLSSLLRKVWSGTGMVAIPWNSTFNPQLDALSAALAAENDKDGTVLRFQHGYFRDMREQDPRFLSTGNGVKDALKDLAAALQITGNPQLVGEFAVPPLRDENIRLWARRDDLGLLWKYPSHYARLTIKRADEYPKKRVMAGSGADALAYPFSYSGSVVPPLTVVSPLCSRTVGRSGYLCRPLPPDALSCASSSSSSSSSSAEPIRLIKCKTASGTIAVGPRICPDFQGLYKDTGVPLQVGGRPNPALTPADTSAICSPNTPVVYGNDIPSNACYIGLCVLQSLKDHTLIPGRNSVLTGEATAPYAACIRPDPQLGTYTEIATNSPYPLPMYIGHLLVTDLDREYCVRTGNPPLGLAGLCSENTQLHVKSSDILQSNLRLLQARDSGLLIGDQMQVLMAAGATGQRAALDQTIETERKILASVTNFVSQIADLLQSLSRAFLSKTPCPWTGPMRSSP